MLLIGLTTFQIQSGHERAVRTASANLADTARITEEQVRGSLRVVRLMLRAIAEAPRNDTQALRRYMATRAKIVPEIRQALVANAQGVVTIATAPQIEGTDVGEYVFFREARVLPAGRDIYVAKPLPIGLDGSLVILISMPLTGPDGRFDGIAAVSLELGFFQALLKSVHSGEDGAGALLATPDGDIITRDPEPEVFAGKNIAKGSAFAQHRDKGGAANTFVHVAATDGIEKVFAIRTLTEPAMPPLVVIVARPLNGVLADWRTEALTMAGVVGALVLTILGLTGLASRHLIAMMASEERYRGLIETQNDLVVRFTLDERVVFANEAFARAHGRDVANAIGMSWRDFVYEEDHDATAQAIAEVTRPPAFRATVESRMRMEGGLRWVSWEGAAIRDMSGRIIEVQAVGRDITDWVENRERQSSLLRELDSSNRELEQFAYVASHDLREPLRMITSYLSLLERRYAASLNEDGHQFLDFARDGAKRMDMMVLDLLEFSRVGRVRDALGEVSLAEVISIAEENLRLRLVESGATLSIAPDLPVVIGSHGELIRLMQNLIGNAVKYRQPDRPLMVTISAERSESGWTCTVADNGIGIAPDYFERIFDIFQRLHSRSEYEGTGIGLAVCRKIVEHHGGRIWVESEPGVGSRFRFTLADQPAQSS
ncbi:Phytochrome two-component sensor histidine kinase Cyanobacterial phytochrome B [Paramagnetospirillum magnetotacticum MS-1]|uniref:histidine kinase n=1 Tax=Paramagnetospirillum magnetotacticum MS-1 TaxID=272627 RepID=A0A0C2YW05_PARME|nr:Phytochrome two-component sensor histidine kinase Cyanobacterial phytochrome B [Paramagnetospirillum magnetotacticum MS-1]